MLRRLETKAEQIAGRKERRKTFFTHWLPPHPTSTRPSQKGESAGQEFCLHRWRDFIDAQPSRASSRRDKLKHQAGRWQACAPGWGFRRGWRCGASRWWLSAPPRGEGDTNTQVDAGRAELRDVTLHIQKDQLCFFNCQCQKDIFSTNKGHIWNNTEHLTKGKLRSQPQSLWELNLGDQEQSRVVVIRIHELTFRSL